MDRQPLKRRVRRVVIKALGLKVGDDQLADDEVLFGEGLGAPSVAALELVCALEEEFDFEVDACGLMCPLPLFHTFALT